MVWLDPFVFCESLIHWSLTSIFPGKKRRKLLWRLAKRQLHQYTSFHPLQWWILVVCPSVRLRSLVWTLTLERLSMARRLPTQFPFIFSNGTINKNRRTNNKERKQGSCVCFMLLLTTTFSLESPDLKTSSKGQTLHHDLRNLGMKLLAEISPKLSHRVCWRSIAATKTAGKWWFPWKRPDVPIWLEGLLLMIFSKFATYSLRHVHFQSFSERYTPLI